MALFGYLIDKDEFEEIARKALCRRLLNTAQSFNENWERVFVAKLKVTFSLLLLLFLRLLSVSLACMISFFFLCERATDARGQAKHGDAFTRRLQGMFTDMQDETIQRTRTKFEAWNNGGKVRPHRHSATKRSACV